MTTHSIERSIVDHLFATCSDKVAQARVRPLMAGWFVGQAMKQMCGTGNVAELTAYVATKLGAKTGS